MKRLFLLLALLGMVAIGCSKDEVDKGNDNKTEQPNENEGGNIPDDAYISLNKDIVTISPDGESVDIKVYSNYAWELTNNCDWITTSITSGDASDTGVIVTLTADLTYDDREGTIVFSCGKAKKLLVVSQKFKEVIIPDANNTFNIPAEGGVAVISYQTSVDCEVIIPEEAQSWITIAPATRGLVSENINLDIAENTTYSARTAVIKVVAKDNAELAIEYTINQVQNDAILADEDNTFTLPSEGGNIEIAYRTNVDCEVIIPDEAQDWVTIAPATRGLSTYSTTLNIAENNSGKERNCVIKVTSQDDNELSAEYTIIQKPRYCLYYTSSNGEIVQPYDSSAFGATIISNTYKDGVGVIEFKAPITTIGDDAFYRCSSLTSVTIPDSVTTIGWGAFWSCSSLQEFKGKYASEDGRCLIIDGTLNVFAPAGLTEYTIADSVTTIGDYAFRDCNNLTSITIPDSVTTIGVGAFYSCSSLTSVTIPDSVTTIEWGAFSWCESLTSVTIPNSVTTIEAQAFQYCSLTSVTIPDSVTTIEGGAFYCCSSLQEFNGKFASEDGRCLIVDGILNSFAPAGLTEYTIPNSVTTIGTAAFRECSSLTSVTIPDSVAEIGEMAFFGCYSLTSVTIPDSVTEIKYYAFAYCYDLTSVTIPDSITTIGEAAFYGCSSLTSVTIPDSVTTVGGYAFSGCGNLNAVYITDLVAWCNIDFINPLTDGSVDLSANPLCYAKNLYLNGELVTDLVIPDGVNEIKLMAFALCDSITNVTIPNSVTTIGVCAFYNCSRLTSVTIGDSVTEIGWFAFTYCNNLNTVYCKAINPPTTIVDNNGYWSGFAKVDESGNIYIDCTIYVPTESVKAYKNASGWSKYADAIVGYDF